MRIQEITIRKMKMTMKHPFTNSVNTMQDKVFLLTEVTDDTGNTGWGESVAFDYPWYTEETVETNVHIIEECLIPLIIGKEINHPAEVNDIFSVIRRNNMAKSAIEGAVWDLYAKRNHMTLAEAIGGGADQIEVGISVGIQDSTALLIEKIGTYIREGYKRIKVKIKPGNDIELLRTIRESFPDVPLMADANSAYTLDDLEQLRQLDEFNLMMIEQPLAADDFLDHAKLQKELKTPICLDESIHSLEDARVAIELGSCQVINVKAGRVGGLTEAKKIHDYCMKHHVPVWCGGMLESGIGRAHNVALTTLPNFVLPGDTAGSSHYWLEDIIMPEVVTDNGYITVPAAYGIGYEPNMEVIEKYTVEQKTVYAK